MRKTVFLLLILCLLFFTSCGTLLESGSVSRHSSAVDNTSSVTVASSENAAIEEIGIQDTTSSDDGNAENKANESLESLTETTVSNSNSPELPEIASNINENLEQNSETIVFNSNPAEASGTESDEIVFENYVFRDDENRYYLDWAYSDSDSSFRIDRNSGILIAGISENEMQNRLFESSIKKELQALGYNNIVMASYRSDFDPEEYSYADYALLNGCEFVIAFGFEETWTYETGGGLADSNSALAIISIKSAFSNADESLDMISYYFIVSGQNKFQSYNSSLVTFNSFMAKEMIREISSNLSFEQGDDESQAFFDIGQRGLIKDYAENITSVDYIIDNAGILSKEEVATLKFLLSYISRETGISTVVVTDLSNSGYGDMEYADRIIERAEYGEDAVVLFLNVGERTYYITTSGYAMYVFDDNAFSNSNLEGVLFPHLSEGNYSEAFMRWAEYVKKCSEASSYSDYEKCTLNSNGEWVPIE